LLGLTGLLVLRISTRRLNLSRCAQESHTIWGYPGNTLLFNSDITRKAKLRQRLGAGHSASRIPGRTGVASLLWKDLVISLRTAGFSQLWGWLGIFFTMLGMMIAPVWEIRLIALLFWVYLVGKVATHRLRSDLELWVLFRQLPYRPQAALINELARPVITATCLAWLGFGCSYILGFFPPVTLLLLFPGIILGVALLSARDVLRRCNNVNLISGQVADLGARGVFLSLVFASSPLIATLFIFPIMETSVIWLTSFGGLLLAYGLPIFFLKRSHTVFQKIS
jgi:hypothetical protein